MTQQGKLLQLKDILYLTVGRFDFTHNSGEFRQWLVGSETQKSQKRNMGEQI